MNQQETEQFAALRMHVAHLHNALTNMMDVDSPPDAATQRAARAALAESEPAVKDLLSEADRDAKLQACRDQLAGTTARLAMLEGKARAVIAAAKGAQPDDVQREVDGLTEALQ